MLSGSVVSNSVTPGTVVCQAPLSMGFPRQEYCSGWPFPPPGDLPGLGSEPGSLTLAGGVVNCCATGEAEEAHDITAIKIDPHTHTNPGTSWSTGRKFSVLVPNRKRSTQGCILSPCSLNLHAEYIMRNAGLEEAHAGIKIAGRNTNNLRYADDTTLMAECEEELKSLLMKVKEESEKVG